jgi:hypothetical protein
MLFVHCCCPAGETISESYDTEYSTDKIEMHTGAVQPGNKVVLVSSCLRCVLHHLGVTQMAASEMEQLYAVPLWLCLCCAMSRTAAVCGVVAACMGHTSRQHHSQAGCLNTKRHKQLHAGVEWCQAGCYSGVHGLGHTHFMGPCQP